MEPQLTSEFEQTNPDEGNPTMDQASPQNTTLANTSTKPPSPEVHNNDDVVEDAADVNIEKSQPDEDEHSTTNNHPNKQTVLADDHTIDTDEFLNSSSEHAHSAKTGDSNGDEGTSVSKPPPDVYLPRKILQGLKDLTPDEALDKLLSSFGAYIPTAADREKALQLEQAEHEERFRREVIEGDMLGLLERDPTIYFNIKALFNQLQTPGTRADLFLLVTQAEALLEQYAKHFQQLRSNSLVQEAKLKLKEQHFEQAKQRNSEAAQMKAEATGAFLQMAACVENISHWRAEIRELEQKIAEEEAKKEDFAAQAAAVSRLKIEELARDGIQQYSEGLVVSSEVDRLANENEVLRRKLAHTKEQYEHFRAANKTTAD
jgi:hypothetical protein